MIKRLGLALAGLFAFVGAACASGTIPLSMTQQFDSLGRPLSGGKLYLIQAGTTATPQNAYQDSGLTIPLPNPITLDASGRIPQFFLADGSIKVRLTDASGVTQIVADGILVIGPSSGGGGGGGDVDPTTIFETGAIKAKYGTGSLSGWVRLNGRTIGSATSGATERANADTQALFEYLWGADSSLTVSGGRGATAAADWSANKTIALPDFRSRALAGLGDMGNSDNALFDGLTFTRGDATSLGSLVGAAKSTLVTANLPPYTPAGAVSTSIVSNTVSPGGVVQVQSGPGTSVYIPGSAATITASSTFTGTPQGGTSTAFATNSPFALVTFYVKL